ncbi:Uncharacterised protein [Mycobacteroides abscessus]|nr:Uncharacterised protein [Mycobacteroides abscessus]
MLCDCNVAPESEGWRETRGPVCEARDRAVWQEFVSAMEALSFDEMLAERDEGHGGHDASS